MTLSFDDGYAATCESTAGLLRARGWSATYHLITDAVGTAFEGLPMADWAAWQEASRLGHEIASHGAQHAALAGPCSDLRRVWQGLRVAPDRPAYLGQMVETGRALARRRSRSPARPQPPTWMSLAASRSCIARHIPDQAVESLSYPAGRHNAASRRAAARAGFRSARTGDPGLNRAGADPLALRALILAPGSRPAQLEPWLRRACQERAWLILVLHLVAESNPTGYPYFYSCAAFQELLDMLQKRPLWVASQGQVVSYLREQRLLGGGY
ncbi:MAG: polysaccharide deacetylase family protein [Chloroflexia bacterium]|nr:polysaccharide deacetylase family protein [Chloroflexia bacterium]